MFSLFKPRSVRSFSGNNYKLHLGPGPGWRKPGPEWLTVDVDPRRGDIVMDFNQSQQFPLPDNSVEAIYGAHVFEHMSIYAAPRILKECYRVLKPGGRIRLVFPNARKSIEEYLNGNIEYPLFGKRIKSLQEKLGYKKVTIFEAMRGDFISPSGQPGLLGQESLAHQNAWDTESMTEELSRVGFDPANIKVVGYRQSGFSDFDFEGSYPSEANEEYRSLYMEAHKA